MILNDVTEFLRKKALKIIILIVIILFVAFFYILYYHKDLSNCIRNVTIPHYSLNQCFLKYNLYWWNRMQWKCYSPINDSFSPQINHTSDIRVDVYLLNSNLTQDDLNASFLGINSIWNKFGVNFVINTIVFSRANEKISVYGKEEKTIHPELEKYFNFSVSESNNNVIMVICDFKAFTGLHFSHFTIISKKVKNRPWVMAHELGHIMGLYDKAFYSGEINLMTHQSCIQSMYYPTNLNEYQVERVMNITVELYQSQNQ